MDDEKRKEMNNDIIRRLKQGDSLQEESDVTWFPPRPIIKKDPNLIKKLYGDDAKVLGKEKENLEIIKEGNDLDEN